jgi:hypothetical protein
MSEHDDGQVQIIEGYPFLPDPRAATRSGGFDGEQDEADRAGQLRADSMSAGGPAIQEDWEEIPSWCWDQVDEEIPGATDDEAQERAEAILTRRDEDARNDDGGRA